MPRSLTKKYIRMVADDDADALLASLGSPADPRDFHIHGDLLPLRCAMYGKPRCFVALVESRPDLAEQICSLPGSDQRRAIDWIGSSATPAQIASLARLAPRACSEGSRLGSSPLPSALSHGLWDGAAAWLALDPPAALLGAPGGRGSILLAAEPAHEIRGDEALRAAWTQPPQSLIDDLFLHGADPKCRSDKDLTALSRSIAGGSRRVFDSILSRLDNHEMPSMLARAKLAFNPLHEAVWRDEPGMLSALAARGGDLSELTDKNFSLMHLAIRQDSRRCAQVLIDLGHTPDGNPSSSTSSACSAMSSPDPAHWIAWLAQRGVDLDLRDDHGAHWMELAWERLGLEPARGLWDARPAKPPRSADSLLGPLERAARSKLDAVRKVELLLGEGLLPARIAASPSPSQTPSDLLNSLPSRHIRGSSFGVYKTLELGAMWATGPDPTAPRQAKPSGLDDDDDDWSADGLAAFSSARKPAGGQHPRPCLLAYAASLGHAEMAQALLAWGAPSAFWRDADVLCAWREAVRVDANLPTLRLLSRALSDRAIAPWGPDELHMAARHLGPAKLKALGARLPSVGEALARTLCADPQRLAEVFLLRPQFLGDHDSHLLSASTVASDVELYPWRVAIGSPHPGAAKALLPLDSPMPAISALHVAMASARAQKPDLALWAALRCKDLAATAHPSSPWGASPGDALALWDRQMLHELGQARLAHPAAPALSVPTLPEGAASSVLLSMLVRANSLSQARSLVELGIQAPANFTRIADAIEICAQEATSIGKGNELLEPLRAFCSALCGRADFRAILDTCGSRSMLSRLPDPALLATFMRAGASAGGGTSNAFVALCLKYSGRLSPAFAGHLAELSRSNDPDSPLAVASALAAMKPHATTNVLSLEPSAASRLRIERATRGVSPQGWAHSFEHGFCPVEAALEAGNVEIGLALAERAPDGYGALAGSSWPALWIKARAPVIARALGALAKAPGNGDEALAAPALAAIDREVARMAALGLPLSTPRDKDMALAAQGIEHAHKFKSEALSWLLAHGWLPRALVSVAQSFSHVQQSIELLFGRDGEGDAGPSAVPLLSIVLATEPHRPGAVDLCVEWGRAGLPSTMLGRNGLDLPCHLLLDGARSSLYEARVIGLELAHGAPGREPPKMRRRL